MADYSEMPPLPVGFKEVESPPPLPKGFKEASQTQPAPPPTRTAADLINERFPGTGAQEIDVPGVGQVSQPTRQEVGENIRPYAKGSGMILGGIVGGTAGATAGAAASVPTAGVSSPYTVPAGALIGRTIGSGIGTEVGDYASDLIAGKPHQWGESTREGMVANIYGEAGGGLLSRAAEGITNVYRGAKNLLTGRGVEQRAGERLSNIIGSPTEQELANQAKTVELEKRIGIEPLTPAQRTGSTKAGMVEQSLGSTDKEFADQMLRRESEMKETAQNRFLSTMGKGEQLPSTTPPYQVGEAIHAGIEKDLAPVRATEKEIWGEVPQYPIPSHNLDNTIAEINKTPFEKPVQDAVNTTIKYIEEVPRTTEGIRSIEKTLTGNMTKALKNGDNNLFRVYKDMKNAVQSDYEAMGAAAESGDVALYNGKLIYPSKIQGQIAGIEKQIAEESLKPKPAEGIIPGTAGSNYQSEAVLSKLNKDKNALQSVLDSSESAPNVAEKISQAKQFSKEQKFDRFYRGQTKKVLQAGDEFEGQRLPFEQIPQKFYTPSGYKDLVRASGGNAKASERMKPFVVDDLVNSSMQGNEFSVPKALTYLRKNQEVLRMSGLQNEVKDIIKGQMPNEFERMLATKRLDKVSGEPYFTVQESRALLQKYGKSIREFYGPQSVQALRDYHDLLFALSRNKNISMAGGSNTAEKLMNSPDTPSTVKKVVSAISGRMVSALGAIAGISEAVASGGGPGAVSTGAIAGYMVAGAAKDTYTQVVASAEKKTMDLFKRAITDPELADKLIKMFRTRQPASLAQKASEIIKPYLSPLEVAATTKEKPPTFPRSPNNP